MKPTAVVETNFELSLKAKDQCGVKDQGGAVAKLAVTATTQRQRLCDAEDCGEAESDCEAKGRCWMEANSCVEAQY